MKQDTFIAKPIVETKTYTDIKDVLPLLDKGTHKVKVKKKNGEVKKLKLQTKTCLVDGQIKDVKIPKEKFLNSEKFFSSNNQCCGVGLSLLPTNIIDKRDDCLSIKAKLEHELEKIGLWLYDSGVPEYCWNNYYYILRLPKHKIWFWQHPRDFSLVESFILDKEHPNHKSTFRYEDIVFQTSHEYAARKLANAGFKVQLIGSK